MTSLSTSFLDEETDTTMKQPAIDPVTAVASQQSCLVQIYPADVVEGMLLIEQERLSIGRDIQADFVLLDSSVSRCHAELHRQEDGYLIKDLGSTNGTLVNGQAVAERMLCSGDTIRIGNFLFKFLSAGSVESQYHETVYDALTRDALTGAMNKRYLLDTLRREIARAIRQHVDLSVVMLDIDFFKSVNDTHGHLAGDDVLREFGFRIASACREDDMLARYGGEEFCLVLCGANREQALEMAERCRCVIAETPFETSAGALAVTASFGLTWYNGMSPLTPTEIIQQADRMLYQAKHAGRNRVCG